SYEDAKSTAEFLLSQTEHRPTIGIICGSGLGGLAKVLSDTDGFEFRDIPNFAVSTVPGHVGKLVFGNIQGKSVVLMQGRVHMYEGHSAEKITFPVRVFKIMGVNTLIVTNAAGAINRTYNAGDLMIICDHINLVGLAGLNPLVGVNDSRFGPRFPPMSTAYDKTLRRVCLKLAEDLGMKDLVREGVYSFQCGPFYETVGESRLLKVLGADVTGMSTVPEVLVARHCGIRVFGVSLVTNRCVMELDSDEEVNHEEVLLMGEKGTANMQRLILKLV
ncbi:Purine nucleoside phosphorylase, partial [Lamellibrachia satsuma]